MAAGVIAHCHRHLRQISRLLDLRLGSNINTGRRNGVGLCVHFAVTGGGRHVNRPMTGQAKIASPAILDGFEGASLQLRGS